VTAPPLLVLIAVKADDPDGHARLWFMADGAGDLVHGIASVLKMKKRLVSMRRIDRIFMEESR
jgi:hypothetical protein